MSERILIVDDEKEIVDLIEVYLKNDGFTVHKFYNGTEALKCIEETDIDLAILDVMLPDIDGFHICQKIREKFYYPVIMLTAKSTEYDRVLGLDSGADDYICKPFGIMELLSRIKALLRRAKPESEEKAYTVGGLYVYPEKHIVRAGGRDVVLTLKEFELLCLFISHPGTVFTRDQILQKIPALWIQCRDFHCVTEILFVFRLSRYAPDRRKDGFPYQKYE